MRNKHYKNKMARARLTKSGSAFKKTGAIRDGLLNYALERQDNIPFLVCAGNRSDGLAKNAVKQFAESNGVACDRFVNQGET